MRTCFLVPFITVVDRRLRRVCKHTSPVSRKRTCISCINGHVAGKDEPFEDPAWEESILFSDLSDAELREQVLVANTAFYDALRKRSIADMRNVWMSSSDNVSLAHPLQGIIVGLEDVMAAWSEIFSMGSVVKLDVEIVKVDIKTNAAWCICNQRGSGVSGTNVLGGERVATNIFQMRRGEWKMVYHGTSPVIIEDDDGVQRMKGSDDDE